MATLNTQNSFNQTSGSSTTCVLTGVSSGDSLILCLRERDNSAVPTVSDDINGSWGSAVVSRTVSGTGTTAIFAFHGAGSGTTTITISYGTSKVFQGIAAAFTPAGGTTIANDQTNGATTTTTTSHNAGSITAGAGFIVAASAHASNSGGETIGDSMTAFTMTTGEREYHRYKLTSGETLDADYTSTNSISAAHVIASFLESGGAAATHPGWMGGGWW